MSMVTQIAQAMQTVLTTTAEQAARASGFCQRRSKLGGAAFAQTLVFGCLGHPSTRLEDLAQTAAACGAAVYPQALDQRFTPQAADYLRRVLAAAVEQVCAADATLLPLLQKFQGVAIEDSTTVVLPDVLREHWPGCRGGGEGEQGTQAAIKFQVRLNCTTGQLTGPLPGAGAAADQRAALPIEDLPAGALRIADLGYFDLDVFARLQQRQVYWLTRWQPGTALFNADGQEMALLSYLRGQKARVVDVAVQMGANHRLPCRLVAFRVPEPVAEKRRQRLRKKAQKKGKKPSAQQLALCAWNVFLTNVPRTLANVAELSVLARLRWQIELLFKLWKSDGRLDEVRSQKPWRIVCEIFAKMIAVVVQHWLLLVGCWQFAERSLRKAAGVIRQMALALASGLRDRDWVERCIAVIQRCLKVAAKINKRRGEPHSYQLLQHPTVYGEEP
jgi:Transposase DDE domain